ncbi:MAG: hypothetical protein ACLFS7_00445 [Desulfosudaceae bacterium]
MKTMATLLSLVVFFITASAVCAQAGLDDFMFSLNSQAKADIGDFSLKLSSRFGVPLEEVKATIKKVDAPADAFMCFQLSSMTGTPFDKTFQAYQRNKNKGWGAIARELGIKPGSAKFHALKNGDLSLDGRSGRKTPGKPGKGKGKHTNRP